MRKGIRRNTEKNLNIEIPARGQAGGRNSKQIQLFKQCNVQNREERTRSFGFSEFELYLAARLFRI